jgi:DNA-binding transcriptional LysR family regulator
VKPHVVAETDHPEIALALVRAGLGVTIVPAELAAWTAGGSVAVVPLGPERSLEVVVVARHGEPLNPPAEAFWRFVVKRHEAS